MNYQASLDYIWSLVNYETHPPESREPYTLDRFVAFMAALGNPERGLRAVHVAGSKGKGSTSAMVASMAHAAGWHVGFYSSPHLHTPRERIRLGGRPISQELWAAVAAQLRPVADSLGGVTTFEFLTAMAFVSFAAQGIDLAVVEVGLGGRLDATNVVTPLVSVITPISREHTKILGNTLEEIAAEKGGIIKPGVPVVIAPQAEEARKVLTARAAALGAPATLVEETCAWLPKAETLTGQHFDLRVGARTLDDLWLPLLGSHQVANVATAVAAALTPGVDVPPEAVAPGLAGVQWPARVEVLGQAPLVIADGAHNDASAKALAEALTALQVRGVAQWERLWLVLGVSADKELPSLLAPLLPLTARIVATQANHPRALSATDLVARLEGIGLPLPPVRPAATIGEAIALLRREAGPGDAIVATGSLFLAGDFRAAWDPSKPELEGDP